MFTLFKFRVITVVCARRGPHGREGPPAHGRGIEKGAPGPSASPGRAEHDRTRLQPHEALPQAATRHDRLDETSLANLRLILIAIHLKVFIITLPMRLRSWKNLWKSSS